MNEKASFSPTPEQVDAAVEANRDRLEAAIEKGETEIASGKKLHSLEELIQTD